MSTIGKREKHKIVEELGTKLKGLDVMFLAEYSGMNVSQVTRLRKELGNADADFSVTKNSLLRLASEGTMRRP
jgi:large subunit ribosomal protein L10